MSARENLIRDAVAALDSGDLEPLRTLLDDEAEWFAIPQGRDADSTPSCTNRTSIVDRLARVHERGRRFAVGDTIERGDRVAAELVVSDPEWSDSVRMYRVFTFRRDEDVVVRLNDCIDESYALQVLAS
jgi:ketosteroid isomerase-like protein